MGCGRQDEVWFFLILKGIKLLGQSICLTVLRAGAIGEEELEMV